jgi:transposase
VRLARELVSTIRTLNRAIGELDRELQARTMEIARALLELPGCAAVTAAKLLAEIGPIDRFKTDAQLTRHCGVGRSKHSGREGRGNAHLHASRR